MRPILNTAMARTTSLALAIVLSLIYLLQPAWLVIGDKPDHGLLAFAFFGLSALFMHGVGFALRNRLLSIAFHPALAWMLATLPLTIAAIRAST